MQHLSDVFKFTQGLGQVGHQIGRKVGDAIELLTFGMINQDINLTSYLQIEDGIEGATSAKHKVEFSFYNLGRNGKPTKNPIDLFGLIECKKVGVEQTIKQNFKQWLTVAKNKKHFYETDGYSFVISPSDTNYKWVISILPINNEGNNLQIKTIKSGEGTVNIENNFYFNCQVDTQLLIALDVVNELYVLGNGQILSEIENSLGKCVIIQIQSIENYLVKKINVNESLPGPQTPEKAKQASFVSLDVRKKKLGRFDKTDDKSFVSILVIGEASHWEEKSRSMVRLCNDYNLTLPDHILVELFENFLAAFGTHYQQYITKSKYRESLEVRNLVDKIILNHHSRILQDMDSKMFVRFKFASIDGTNRLILEEVV